VTDNLLFIDTEASGLPKNWKAPYSKVNNWPFSVQISWLLYSNQGILIKQENHYISNDDFKITPAAVDIHGITREFLSKNGEPRHKVMELLAEDIKKYQPTIIGHFIELDIHVLSADFFRSGVENPILSLPTFCTMIATKQLAHRPQNKYLRLGDLYQLLFNTSLEHQHDALVDATATAECFFELIEKGEINDEYIVKQQSIKNYQPPFARFIGWVIVILILLLLILLFSYRGTT
jgi:DNA polymerase-3 subunit epsilon